MEVALVAVLIAFGTYYVWIIFLCQGMRRKRGRDTLEDHEHKVSIIVPFRNEQDSIKTTLEELSAQEYNSERYEVIFVDDHSSDSSLEVMKHLPSNFSCVTNSGTGKKSAIECGVKLSKGDVLLFTDADCSRSSQWISSMLNAVEGSRSMVIGPVQLLPAQGMIQYMLSVEFTSLQAVALGMTQMYRPIVCNGANLLVSKQLFLDVDGYSGNRDVHSGDDTFLLEKVKKVKGATIRYAHNSSSLIWSKYPDSLKTFIHQRLRWAGKSSRFRDLEMILAAGLISIINLIVLVGCLLFLTSGNLKYLIPIGLKIAGDTMLFAYTPSYLKSNKWMAYFIPVTFIYPFYAIGILFSSFFYTPEWKGRKTQ